MGEDGQAAEVMVEDAPLGEGEDELGSGADSPLDRYDSEGHEAVRVAEVEDVGVDRFAGGEAVLRRRRRNGP